MFGWVKKKHVVPTITVTVPNPAQRRMREIQNELGFPGTSGSEDWLRLHQILKAHEDRITKLEGK